MKMGNRWGGQWVCVVGLVCAPIWASAEEQLPMMKEEAAASSTGDMQTKALEWYACPIGEARAAYTTQPLDVLCQKAKHPPVVTVGQLAAEGNEALQRLWYEAEFGRAGDLTVLSKPVKIPDAHLRQASPLPVTKTTLRQTSVPVVRPARVVAPPKPLTPKQLIQRDISKEQRALAATQTQLKIAQNQGNTQKAWKLRQSVADRQNNIRALKQELQRQ
ncbi:hypothetical protein [Snodgrassella sp. CFCC 13594]|uniref:hypothetical protein n=1 Tax=Snodgrassella sp. CFCC 13594 TaxID=1775559 RepID=UPI000A55946E|nr:hypothetical protein [Snodgrassella sp. CFCC 13594]